jgi:hypothetical protein
MLREEANGMAEITDGHIPTFAYHFAFLLSSPKPCYVTCAHIW